MASSYGAIEYADARALIAYSVDYVATYTRAGRLIDRILKGADPAAIPVLNARSDAVPDAVGLLNDMAERAQ